MNTKMMVLSAACLTFLAGCGGGGGGGSTGGTNNPSGDTAQTPTTPVDPSTISTPSTTDNSVTGPVIPIEAALIQLYSNGQVFNRTNVIGNDTYVVSATYTKASPATFEGRSVQQTAITRNATKNGQPFFASNQTDFFETAPDFKINGRDLHLTYPTVADSYYVTLPNFFKKLPASGKPGDGGQFYNSSVYSAPDKKVVIGGANQSWTVSSTPTTNTDSATTAIFCINTTIAVGQNTAKQADCFKIAAAGDSAPAGTVKSVLFSTPGIAAPL